MNTEKNIEEISYQFVIGSLKVMKSFLVHAIVELDAKHEQFGNEMGDDEHFERISEIEMLVDSLDAVIKTLKE